MPLPTPLAPLLTSLLLAAVALAPPDHGSSDCLTLSRERQVLDLLQRLPDRHSHLGAVAVVESVNAFGCAQIAPRVVGLCGTGWRPAFDPALARAMALELCRLYGLAPEREVAAPNGVAAQLDCFDAAAGIGLELRGAVIDQALPNGGTWPTVVDEAPELDLSVAEHATLKQAQRRIHVADAQAFWNAPSEDRTTTTLAYLATVARFLDEITSGEKVDLRATLAPKKTVVALPAVATRPGLEVLPFGGGAAWRCARAQELRLAIDPRQAFDPATGKPRSPLSNRRRPTVAWIGGLTPESGSFTVTLEQTDAEGRSIALARAASDTLFLPGAFDATRPFTLVVALEPGSYRLHDHLWIGAPAEAR